MAKVDINKLLKSLRGRIGDLVFRRMPDGSTVVSGAPRKGHEDSPAQKAHQFRFAEGSSFAKWAQHHYPIYAELAADLPTITAYNLALKDISHPPVIHRILREGERILVNASDEIMVAGVRVMVHNEQGKLIEAGDAQQTRKDWWEYIPKAAGKVSASAWDLPGNKVRVELE